MLQSVMDMPHSQAQSMEQVSCRVLADPYPLCMGHHPGLHTSYTDPIIANVRQLGITTYSAMVGCIAVGDTREVFRGVEGVPAAGRAA